MGSDEELFSYQVHLRSVGGLENLFQIYNSRSPSENKNGLKEVLNWVFDEDSEWFCLSSPRILSVRVRLVVFFSHPVVITLENCGDSGSLVMVVQNINGDLGRADKGHRALSQDFTRPLLPLLSFCGWNRVCRCLSNQAKLGRLWSSPPLGEWLCGHFNSA